MFTYNVYSVYDSKADSYSQPLFSPNDAVATRSFSFITMDAEHPICHHPEDYTLMRIGMWDSSTGKLIGESPVGIINGVQAKAQGELARQATATISDIREAFTAKERD